MSLLLDSFWRAVAYCLHPRVIGLSLLPLVLLAAAALVLGLVFWDSAVQGVFLWLESAPPSTWGVDRGKFDMTFFLDLTLTAEALEIAAHEWEAELERFPQRV